MTINAHIVKKNTRMKESIFLTSFSKKYVLFTKNGRIPAKMNG